MICPAELTSEVSAAGGGGRTSPSNIYWSFIHDTLARELGRFRLVDSHDDPPALCHKFLLTTDTAGALDLIELSFRVIDRGVRELHRYPSSLEDAEIKQRPDEAIEELNHRFREHGIGYQYLDGQLVRVDPQFTHAEIVKPALSLLHEVGFDGAADEFLKGFDHFRHGRTKEAIAESLKAFESTVYPADDDERSL